MVQQLTQKISKQFSLLDIPDSYCTYSLKLLFWIWGKHTKKPPNKLTNQTNRNQRTHTHKPNQTTKTHTYKPHTQTHHNKRHDCEYLKYTGTQCSESTTLLLNEPQNCCYRCDLKYYKAVVSYIYLYSSKLSQVRTSKLPLKRKFRKKKLKRDVMILGSRLWVKTLFQRYRLENFSTQCLWMKHFRFVKLIFFNNILYRELPHILIIQ